MITILTLVSSRMSTQCGSADPDRFIIESLKFEQGSAGQTTCLSFLFSLSAYLYDSCQGTIFFNMTRDLDLLKLHSK